MRAIVKFVVLLGAASVLCFALWPARRPAKTERKSALAAVAQTAPEREQPSAVPLPPAEVVPAALAFAPVRAAPLPNEETLMTTLRTLGDSAPERSLELARAAEQRFPASPDAAERSWYVCKSLVNLERFYDAREEARRMVSEYPGTSWATDVARHLLVNPPGLPGDPAP